jgi:ADP-ribose pyrophosphatase YjhB (NUDIX family)
MVTNQVKCRLFLLKSNGVANMIWKPNVTVGAVIEQEGHFLLVEENTPGGLVFNQPAGHLEEGEDFITAIKREVGEETAWQFEPQHLLGVQLWRKENKAITYLRICFSGHVHSHNPLQALDKGIVATHWLTYPQLLEKQGKLRSPLVLTCVENYLHGERYPLSVLQSLLNP